MMAGDTRIGAGLSAFTGLVLAAAVFGAQASWAQQAPLPAAGERPVVLEMFTAQGCAACPPADAVFAGFADQPGVIALALHVDYWDYLGWEDSFANPAFTERQKAYARAARAKMIYTPQVIVGGVDRAQGNKSAEIGALLAARQAEPAPVRLQIRREGRQLRIEASSAVALASPSSIQLVRYLPREDVSIEDGENAGHHIAYRNIVTDWQQVGVWDGAAPLALDTSLAADVSPEQPLVVIVQQEGPGAILAAAQID